MHNPRGSNDRNCERNANRNNGNRLFDSQNNNNGGYACPRAVGDEKMQPENGQAPFMDVNTLTGDTSTFYQNKRMYYYEGSILPLEWTDQHGCGGNSKISCEMVLQYACEDTLDPRVDNFWPWVDNKAEVGTTFYGKQHFRSGANIAAPRDGVPRDSLDAATDTIPDTATDATPDTVETRRFGMFESYDSYQLCQHTERNKGLYNADQRVRRNDRRGTRQNPNGNRNGLECPEERDYYPWWAPSPWIDIAVLSDSAADTVCYHSDTSKCTKRCRYYMNNTMNFNNKGYCDVNRTAVNATVQTKLTNRDWINRQWYNNKVACEKKNFVWYEVSHSDYRNFSENSFVCAKTQFSRVNQLGNGASDTVVSQNELATAGIVSNRVVEGVNANRFLWTVPKIPTAPATYFGDMKSAYKSCVLRMRYNVSSADFQQWPTDAVDTGASRMVDAKNNSIGRNDPNTPLQQNPYVTIGPGDTSTKGEAFVKLKVNTNQYGRTFQDRSYVFSIKPLPSANAAATNIADSPQIDATSMQSNLAAGGKIYNVNVRGKRGNIVQVYPSVEYDFVPNMLALGNQDMIHFQWTGSDYNPRRGCNDATGGPPDLNLFNTDANANLNSRADRSNLVFTDHMGNNVPKDYLGYNPKANMTFAEKEAMSRDQVLQNAPCYDPATDSAQTAQDCYDQIMRLAYLNQQSDSGSLVLRQGMKCLTQDELNLIAQEETADNHPLNCAKINAKPYPYYDAGVMMMKKSGWFPFYSSRNNNFSNRQNIGIVCVGANCAVDPSTGVLQDTNPQKNGQSLINNQGSTCYDNSDNTAGQSNQNGVISCIPEGSNTTTDVITVLSTETFVTSAQDNDNYGDGNAQGCAVLAHSLTISMTSSGSNGGLTEGDDVAIAVSMLFVGLALIVIAYCLYIRFQAREKDAWKNTDTPGNLESRFDSIFRRQTKKPADEWLAGDKQSRTLRPMSFQDLGHNPKSARYEGVEIGNASPKGAAPPKAPRALPAPNPRSPKPRGAEAAL